MGKRHKEEETPKVTAIPEEVCSCEECTCEACEPCELEPVMMAGSEGGGEMFSYGFEELVVMTDIENRIFYINEEIEPHDLTSIAMFIIKANINDAGLPAEERMPIKLIINSYGGSVLDGLGLIDIIQASETPVISIVIGYACSMAFVIAVSCNYRVAMKNAVLLNHDGQTGIVDSSSKFRDTVKFYDRVDERLDKLIASKSKLTMKELADTKRQETYMFADEAKDLGLIDAIIGEDISFVELFTHDEEGYYSIFNKT